VAGVLRIEDPDTVDRRTRFIHLGLNSLLATELRLRLESALTVSVTTAAVMQHPSTELLAEYLDRQLAGEPAGEPAG
jgi:acyl carrier protein